jgi:hypothetical protein
MNWDRLVIVASVLASASCGSSGGDDAEAMPSIEIRSQTIADGTTNAGQGPFVVTFVAYRQLLDASMLADLGARLGITTWPEGTAVPVTVAVEGPTSLNGTAPMGTARVSPEDLLAGRWYALRFGPPAAGLATQQTFDSDVWGVRLRPDSQPAVRLVEFCAADAMAGMKLVVTFSEPVTVDSPPTALTVQQNGAPVSCMVYGVVPTIVYELCETLSAAPATVSLAAGTVSGPDSTFLAAQSWPVDIAQLPTVESGCRGYRVPL